MSDWFLETGLYLLVLTHNLGVLLLIGFLHRAYPTPFLDPIPLSQTPAF